MKKKIIVLLCLVCIICVICAILFIKNSGNKPTTSEYYDIEPLVGTALDYSDKSNWMHFDDNDDIDHEVDVFYLYPTSVSADCKTIVGEVDDSMKKSAEISYLKNASALETCGNIYAPYYRQVSLVGIMQEMTADGLMNLCKENVTRTDVYSALDYYFENCNNGKPFILAGHSQGSCNLKIVLSEYMKVHPEYLKKMIACYAIGYYFPQSWLDENPQIKTAEREDDYGVLISWNTEAPDGKKYNLPIGNNDGFCINPLNWKIDETPASIEENKGSVIVDSETLKRTSVDGMADARLNKERGVVVCTTSDTYLPDNVVFGDKSFHMDDWALYYYNIRENAQKRIEAYLNDNK